MIPGGRGPEYLRTIPKVLEITQYFISKNLPIAAICHGPQILCAIKGSITGKKVTAYPALQHDLENVGGIWQSGCPIDGAVVDGKINTYHKYLTSYVIYYVSYIYLSLYFIYIYMSLCVI